MVGRAEVLSPRDICSCHVLWDSPLCCPFVGLEHGHVSAGMGEEMQKKFSPACSAPCGPSRETWYWGECLQAGALQEKLWAVCAEQQDAFHDTKALGGLLKEV